MPARAQHTDAPHSLPFPQVPQNPLYVDMHDLEREEAQVQRMAALTIALNKDRLAGLHRKQGGTGQGSAHPSTVPGKGVLLGALHSGGTAGGDAAGGGRGLVTACAWLKGGGGACVYVRMCACLYMHAPRARVYVSVCVCACMCL